jgi:hypothetical protein
MSNHVCTLKVSEVGQLVNVEFFVKSSICHKGESQGKKTKSKSSKVITVTLLVASPWSQSQPIEARKASTCSGIIGD